MILADTSVVIDILRSRDARLLDIAIDQQAAICGVTRAEVLHGPRDANHRAKLLRTLDLFLTVPMPDALWDQVGDVLATLRAAGLTVPLADVVIAVVAVSHDLELWAHDKHFGAIQRAIPVLKLFQESP